MKACHNCLHPVSNLENDYCTECLIENGREAVKLQKQFDDIVHERDEYYHAYTSLRDSIDDAKERIDDIIRYLNNDDNGDFPRILHDDISILSDIINRLDSDCIV